MKLPTDTQYVKSKLRINDDVLVLQVLELAYDTFIGKIIICTRGQEGIIVDYWRNTTTVWEPIDKHTLNILKHNATTATS